MILTTFGRPGYLRRAMEAGAAGFLLKDAPAERAGGGDPPGRRRRAGRRPRAGGRGAGGGRDPLTEREREVLAAARGRHRRRDRRSPAPLSEGTVRNYLSTAIQKLGAHNRVEAVRIAEEKGWL